MSEAETVTVSILDKEYQVSCQPDEVSALKQSASLLDQKMREMKASANVPGLDRLAVIAALNIANDYLGQTKKTTEVIKHQASRIQKLTTKLDQALNRLKVLTKGTK